MSARPGPGSHRGRLLGENGMIRQPGNLHRHVFGTATPGFADEVRQQAGDTFEIEPPFGLPLRNPLAVAAALSGAVAVKPL